MPQQPNRREFIKSGTAAAAGLALFPASVVAARAEFDLVIRGGTIIDGTGGGGRGGPTLPSVFLPVYY